MDRLDPDNFDYLARERRTTVRGLEIEHFPDGENPDARGHEFALLFHVGPRTSYRLTANAAELRRWSKTLAEAVLRVDDHPEDGPTCPACRGDVHVDLAGEIWSTTAAAADRARALHRPIEYRPGDHYANYGPPSKRAILRGADERPEVVTVCEECQKQIDDLLLSESGGYGSWEIAEYPCRTIRAADGAEVEA